MLAQSRNLLSFRALVSIAGLCWVLSAVPDQGFLPAAQAEAVSQLDALRDLQSRIREAVDRARPAFAFIRGIVRQDEGGGISNGSGFVVSPEGYVLTNDHVVAGCESVEVFLTGGAFYDAEIIGRDPHGDVALLRLDGASLVPFLRLGDSTKVRPGQRVIALGDPFLLGADGSALREVPPNFEPSVSVGIVSAVERYSETYNDAIQVDLAINRGNSGGPLLTLDGEVIGINGKIESRFCVGINTGVGYAISSNQVGRFFGPLKAASGGTVLHGTIHGLEVAERVLDHPGLPVTSVGARSPAARAGFQEGDYLLRIGGLPVHTRSRFKGILGTYPAGEKVEAEVLRDGRPVTLTATVIASGRPFLGMVPQTVSGDLQGVRVESVERMAPADRGGLQPGDIITRWNGEMVRSAVDLKLRLDSLHPGDEVAVTVLRGGKVLELEVMLGGKPE